MTGKNFLMIKRFRNKSSHDLKQDFEKFRGSDIVASKECQDILSRTRVVTDAKESAKIVDRILDLGSPVAVDMEGVVSNVTSMIQICDINRNITLFRTGINPDLYWKGKLAKVLESPDILKILHAASVDCTSVYKDGVKMWNIYDTSVAYKVLEYQRHGISIKSSHQISFNNLCNHYQLPENPLKDHFKNILWKMELTKNGKHGLDTAKTLEDKLLVYCAWDVEPLHRLYELLTSDISPSFQHLVTQLSEQEIIRAIDPALCRIKRKNLSSMEQVTLFLSDLPRGLGAPVLYTCLDGHAAGHRHVYSSPRDRTAHVILDNRQEAVTTQHNFTKWATKEMIQAGTKCELIVRQYENELVGEASNNTNDVNSNTEIVASAETLLNQLVPSSNLLNIQTCKALTKILIKTKCPIVVECSIYSDKIGLTMYTGIMPLYRVLLTPEILTDGGLGDLLANKEVTKIFLRLDNQAIIEFVKFLHTNNVSINGVYDVNMAAKSLDYLHYGQSLIQQQSLNSKDLLSFLGIQMNLKTSQHHRIYMAFLETKQQVPDSMKETLDRFSDLYIKMASAGPKSLKFKQELTDLKKQIDQHSVHLRLISSKLKMSPEMKKKVQDSVEEFVGKDDSDSFEIVFHAKCALIYLKEKHRIRELIKHFEEEDVGLKFSVTATRDFKTVLEKPPRKPDLLKLENLYKENVEKLQGEMSSINHLFSSNVSNSSASSIHL